jgi:spermidine synthase
VQRGERLLAVEEGAYGIAAVTERAGSRRLKLNNHYTLGGTFATGDERLQAHLPLLLHPHPRRVVFLGFGTGITAGGALFHSNVSVQAVELAPEVTRLAATYFAEANGNFHTRSNTQLALDDARNFLRGTRETFDVIVSDIVVPWQPGEAALYTVEHFSAAKRALNKDGIFCVWAPAFQLGETEFKILVRTFLTVFGSAQLWRGDFSPTRPAVALVASDRPLQTEAMARRIFGTTDPANPHLNHARGLWLHFVGAVSGENLEERRINSEDRPWLELLAPLREGAGGFFVGRKLASFEAEFATEAERWTAQVSGDALAGYRGGRLMVEWTQATFDGDQRRAQEIQARMREVLGDELYRLLFGLK